MSASRRTLPRVLGLFDVTVLSSAAMGPAYSLAATMGPMVAAAGTRAPLSLGVLTAIMLCIAIAFSRLSRAMPSAGSSFAWISHAFGPGTGTYAAWLLLLSNYFATTTVALPAATYTLDLLAPRLALSPLWDALVGSLWIAASTLLLYVGLRPTAVVTALFLIAELAVVAASSIAAFVVHPAPEQLARVPLPLPAPGFVGVISAIVLGIWMTDGWEVSASASEETMGPPETPGRAGIVGLLATGAVLLCAMSAYLHVGSIAGFTANQSDAMDYVAKRLGGPIWPTVIVATVLVSTAATLWTTLLYLSRSVYAMGRDGVLPRFTGTLDRNALPTNSLAVVFIGVIGMTLLTGLWPTAASVLDLILNGTSVFLGALFCMSAAAAIKMLAGRPGESRATTFVIPAAGASTLAALIALDIAQSDRLTRYIEIGGLLLGIPFALWRSGKMNDAEALLRAPLYETKM